MSVRYRTRPMTDVAICYDERNPCGLTTGNRMTCTADDHDTTDMFCGACGVQLHEAAQCDWCDRGQHEGDGSPFCPCCGSTR